MCVLLLFRDTMRDWYSVHFWTTSNLFFAASALRLSCSYTYLNLVSSSPCCKVTSNSPHEQEVPSHSLCWGEEGTEDEGDGDGEGEIVGSNFSRRGGALVWSIAGPRASPVFKARLPVGLPATKFRRLSKRYFKISLHQHPSAYSRSTFSGLTR
jgi:hypothetical protein